MFADCAAHRPPRDNPRGGDGRKQVR